MTLPITRSLFVALLLVAPALAQISPEENIRKIVDEIAEEMAEIDRLLLQSSRDDAGEGMERNVERLRELMDQATDSQGRAIRGIDRLIDELQDMAQQSSSGGSPQDQQQRQDQQQQDQQQQSQREQSETPDMVEQGGQPEDQKEPKDQPQDGSQEQPQQGANRRGGQANEDGSEATDREGDADHWGDLPRYIQLLHSRGGIPEVPEKYRRAYEAYLRRANQGRERR